MSSKQDARQATVAAYDAHAATYAAGTAVLPDSVAVAINRFVAALDGEGLVLEIGSGGGRDAAVLEERGLRVRRTDIAPAFVTLMREQGLEADVLDPLTDDLGGPYDGVWASACLLHVDRADLPRVLTRLAEATRPGGALHVSLKEGDGEVWSTHGSVAAPRHFVLWREAALREVLEGAGWVVEEIAHILAKEQPWLDVYGSRR